MRGAAAAFLSTALVLLPGQAPAQSESERDRGYLTGLIEDSLAGDGRTVRLDGFSGAFSSRATFDQLAIGDANGEWLIVRNGAITWRRTALLQGRLQVNELSAAEIELLRPPMPAESGPSAVATEFALPELPVSVNVGAIRADRIMIGEPFLGERIEGRASGSLRLEGGEGQIALNLERTDGKTGVIAADGRFSNATRLAELTLVAEEGPGGLFARLSGVPGEPALRLSVSGAGTVDDFSADLSLTADGRQTIDGTIRTVSRQDDVQAGRVTTVSLDGNVVPLFAPAYEPFFGDSQSFDAAVRRDASGGLTVDGIAAQTGALTLTGRAAVAADGLPQAFDLSVRVGLPDGARVTLPVAGAGVSVARATLDLSFDAAEGDIWQLSGSVDGFRGGGATVGRLSLDGSGRIGRAGIGGRPEDSVDGTVSFSLSGAAYGTQGLDEALGDALTGRASFAWSRGSALSLTGLDISGDGFGLKGDVAVGGPDGATVMKGRLAAHFDDAARLSTLAGRPLGGAVDATLDGMLEPLGGAFDLTGNLRGENLRVGQPQADNLLKGESEIALSVARDTGGTEIRSLVIAASTLSLSGSGTMTPDSEDLVAELRFSDLGALGGGFGGSLAADATVTRRDRTRTISLTGTGRNLKTGQAQADRLLRGETSLSVRLSQTDGTIGIDTAELANPQFSAGLSGSLGEGTGQAAVTMRLADLGLFAPDFPGPLTVKGDIRGIPSGFSLDLRATGPGATDARVTGTVARDFTRADLATRGSAQLAVLNPLIEPRNVAGPVTFDLRLAGPPALASVSGRLSGTGIRIVAPEQGLAVEGITLDVAIAGSRATLRASGRVVGGGSVDVSGTIGFSGARPVDLAVDLRRARLRDPNLYSTTVSGMLSIGGTMTGGLRIAGDLVLGETEVLIPSAGFGADPLLEAMIHLNEPPAVRLTRSRAGQLDSRRPGTPTPARAAMIDVGISAPQRIFVRGRGLDAEMGGSLRIVGPSNNVGAVGQFDLIRGRFDLLGKRLELTEGLVELTGALVPFVRFRASVQANGIDAGILLEGRADDPAIRFTSSPPLPEEEIVAQILFGRSLSSLSAFQAAQLVTAVGALTGSGSGGIVGRLRQSFGLDDLDVRSGQSGLAVTIGKYLTSNLYIDLSFEDSQTEVSLNLDLTDNTKARAFASSDNRSGIGIFFERDY